jgi:hypothetical protein
MLRNIHDRPTGPNTGKDDYVDNDVFFSTETSTGAN